MKPQNFYFLSQDKTDSKYIRTCECQF